MKNIAEFPKETNEERCDVIHVGFVCAGQNSILSLHTLLKSLLFFKVNPIHFHIITNKSSENILRTLFTTWSLSYVNVSFYDVNELILDVRWVPNKHYSGIFGLLKLVIPKVIPFSITRRIIILDTDLILMGDIAELWKLFRKFRGKQAIGIVDNQSNFYLGNVEDKQKFLNPTHFNVNEQNLWPALGRGFNSGVLLYDLPKLQEWNWLKLWPNITKKYAFVYGPVRLADQDVINAVIFNHPDLLYKLPCYWNTQLSTNTLSHNCYEKFPPKIIHWNSPLKLLVHNKDAEYFKGLHTTFLEYNGNLLRNQLKICDNITNNTSNNESVKEVVCKEFHRATTMKWRTLLFFRLYQHNPVENDVSFVAQLSFDRLQMVEELVKYWHGPISLTLYVTDSEFQDCLRFIENSDLLKDRSDIAYHAVFKDGEYHPINILRNVGLKNVNTPYVFLADIDFLPVKGLYSILKGHIAATNMNLKALIVPAFETQRYRSRLPSNKAQLLQMLEKKSVFPFRYDVWAAGHSPTNYTRWKSAISPYKVKWEPDFEPYIVVRSDVTPYDNRFMGFGWNKVSHIMELEALGYEWIVLPNAFIIHKPHAPSYDIAKFRASPTYRMCLQNLKEQFVDDLRKRYGRVFQNDEVSDSNNIDKV